VFGSHRFQSEIVKDAYTIYSNTEKLGYNALEGAASPQGLQHCSPPRNFEKIKTKYLNESFVRRYVHSFK